MKKEELEKKIKGLEAFIEVQGKERNKINESLGQLHNKLQEYEDKDVYFFNIYDLDREEYKNFYMEIPKKSVKDILAFIEKLEDKIDYGIAMYKKIDKKDVEQNTIK